jgi:Rha family phage regulatory protein
MTNLQLVFKQDERDVLMTDSKRLAENFGARHDSILRKIDGILSKSDAEFTAHHFVASDYVDASGKVNRLYQMTRDGFMHIALTFTNTVKGNAFRITVINAFNAMEAELLKNKPATLPFDPTDALSVCEYYASEIKKERALRLVSDKASEMFQGAITHLKTEIEQRPVDLMIDNTVAAADIIANPAKYPGILKRAQQYAQRFPNTFNVIKMLGCITRICLNGGCTEIKAIGPSGEYRCQYNRADIDRLEARLSGKVVVCKK